jgi:hypothetical protein
MRYITVYLRLNHSGEIRKTLKRNGFAIYHYNSHSKALIPAKESIVFLHENEQFDGYVCLYNGEKSLEEMGINRRELEESEALVVLREQYNKPAGDSPETALTRNG